MSLFDLSAIIDLKSKCQENCYFSTLWNIHIQKSQLGCPGLYQKSNLESQVPEEVLYEAFWKMDEEAIPKMLR